MLHRRIAGALALGLALLLSVPASAVEDAAPAPASDAAAPKRPKGKWPWFKRYRKQAAEQPPAVTEAPAPPAEPAPPRADAGAPTPESRMAQRRRMRAERTSTEAVPRRASARDRATSVAPAPVPRALQSFDRAVRDALDIPAAWDGAPPVRELTSSPTALAVLEPIQARLGSLVTSPADEARARADAGAAFIAQGQGVAGAAECLAALRRDPDLSAAWNNIATVLRREGKFRLAEDALERAIELEPSSGLARFDLGMLRDAQERTREAEAEYLRALELDPTLWVPQRNPMIIGNAHAAQALHRLYLKREGRGGVLLDDTMDRR